MWLIIAVSFVLAILLLWKKMKSEINKNNPFYSSPFKDATEMVETIKSNETAVEDLKDLPKIKESIGDNREDFLELLPKLKNSGEGSQETYRLLILKIRQILIYTISACKINPQKTVKQELRRELEKMTNGVVSARDMVNSKLGVGFDAEIFYLQKTLLQYFDDFDEILLNYA